MVAHFKTGHDMQALILLDSAEIGARECSIYALIDCFIHYRAIASCLSHFSLGCLDTIVSIVGLSFVSFSVKLFDK